MLPWRDDPSSVRPMLAATADAALDSSDFVYEPKYDGIRALVSTGPAGRDLTIRSRRGNDKETHYPAVAAALREWARAFDRAVVVDGEIVALDPAGDPTRFQHLQRRNSTPTAFVAFDLLRLGDEDLRPLPLRERRARLEQLFQHPHPAAVRVVEQAIGDGRPLHARAERDGWEGLIAKRLSSPYRSGLRSADWRTIKLLRRQCCVVAGWTAPRGSRPFFGALLLGVHDEDGQLRYVGHTGAGFTDAELGRVWKRLHGLRIRSSPFATVPRTNEKPHWVKPRLVAEVKFSEWTADGRLRQPTYVRLRDDVDPRSVRKEPELMSRVLVAERDVAAERGRARKAAATAASPDIVAQLDALQEAGGNGSLQLPGGERLEVTNLSKVFWPKLRLTKGDLFRHYARVAPFLLPVLDDRPLVMKRYPNGVDAKPFYQHRAPDKLPPGVRIANVETENEVRAHIIGGTLKTLLYTVQLASISQDPWFSRTRSLHVADHVAIDLDPPDGAPFTRVLDVARWVRDELDTLGATGFPKTSGSGGLHVYIPMPPETPYEAGLLFCQIVATMVARRHPKEATVERAIKARGSRIYVDYLQNAVGKTLACAYSARANEFAGVSTPLTWDEVESGGISPKDFTIRNFAARMRAAGDLWAALREARGADLRAVMKYAEPGTGTGTGTKKLRAARRRPAAS
jgi:bifunctional non-homologous end joining protein LigD